MIALGIAGALTRDSGMQAVGAAQPSVAEAVESGAISPALRRKLAASTRFSPGEPQYEQGEASEGEGGDGAQDWYMHASPGTDIPLAAISSSREDSAILKARGNAAAKLGDRGQWENLGPDNAVYPLNQFRNRYVYVPNQYVAIAGPRTAPSTRIAVPRAVATGSRTPAAASGARTTRSPQQPRGRSASPTVSSSTTPPRSSSTRTIPRPERDLRRHPRLEHLSQRLPRGGGLVQVEGRWRPLVRPARQLQTSAPAASARSR